MPKNVNWWTRKIHRWCAIVSALPMLLVIVSGLLLQVKKQAAWIQPPTQRGTASDVRPKLNWDEILDSVRSLPDANVEDWSDIDRLDVRPSRGIVKVRCKSRWEAQIDLQDGAVLSSSYRRSDFVESLHDGSFFSEPAKLWIFLPNGLALLVMWLTGVWLWYLPIRFRSRSKQRKPS